MIQIFDTETTGLPRNWKAPMSDVDNWPRVIQLAYLVFDDNGNEVTEYNELIKPDGWTVPTEKFWIENGFSQEESMAKGLPIRAALDKFLTDYNSCRVLVAHNINYDHNVLGAELIRAGMKADHKNRQICTMTESTDLCKIPGPYGFKWPRLEELHKYLFGEIFDNAHDALADVRATARCLFELRRRGVVNF